MTEQPATKRCSRCNRKRRVKFFSKMTKSKDGLQAWCKSCVTEHRRDLRQRYKNAVEGAAARQSARSTG